MKKIIRSIFIVVFVMVFHIDSAPAGEADADIRFHPVKHATFVIEADAAVIYVDPVGEPESFSTYPQPDIILITDIHRDHLNKDVVSHVKKAETLIVCTSEVQKVLNDGRVLNNGESLGHQGISIEAIPAYNLTPERLKFHPKGRGNGYVLTISGKRIYISGDTEDIPEMRSLGNISYAFVCMNLPYTMTVEQAASAVLEFKPEVVFPYHYRGKNGMSDVEKFRETVEEAGHTQVKFLAWY